MVDRDTNHALLSTYRHSIVRYQKLLKTYVTDLERNYIRERLSACQAAVKALAGSEMSRQPDGLVKEATNVVLNAVSYELDHPASFVLPAYGGSTDPLIQPLVASPSTVRRNDRPCPR